MRVGILAGESSGDLLGAGLIRELKKHCPELIVTGIGGPAMIAEGCESLFEMERLSVMGLVEPLFRLPELFNIRRKLYQYFLNHRPDVFIGIDSPDFNLGLEMKLRRAGIPVVHYVSPSVWAWRQKRIHKIAKAADLVLTLFPFETEFYKKHHVPAKFVGHPLADLIPLKPDKQGARKKLGLDADAIYIALLPGSRQHELKYLAELFVESAKRCHEKKPEIKFITSAVSDERNQQFQDYFTRLMPALPVTFFQGCSHDVMNAADVVLVTSGTATLETMLFKRPMVIAYRMANLTWQIGRRVVKIPFIGLPNILAGKLQVPELLQDAATPENISAALLDFLDHPEKIALLENDFSAIHQGMRCNADQQAAKAVMELISGRNN